MSVSFGAQHRMKVYPSGKRVRQSILNGRVIETKPMPRIKKTRTRRSLRRARRRIGI